MLLSERRLALLCHSPAQASYNPLGYYTWYKNASAPIIFPPHLVWFPHHFLSAPIRYITLCFLFFFHFPSFPFFQRLLSASFLLTDVLSFAVLSAGLFSIPSRSTDWHRSSTTCPSYGLASFPFLSLSFPLKRKHVYCPLASSLVPGFLFSFLLLNVLVHTLANIRFSPSSAFFSSWPVSRSVCWTHSPSFGFHAFPVTSFPFLLALPLPSCQLNFLSSSFLCFFFHWVTVPSFLFCPFIFLPFLLASLPFYWLGLLSFPFPWLPLLLS